MGRGGVMQTIKTSDLWNDYRTNNNAEKTAEIILDVLTTGIWASWDGEKIERFKKQLINRYEL
jgi:hypothetical protein